MKYNAVNIPLEEAQLNNSLIDLDLIYAGATPAVLDNTPTWVYSEVIDGLAWTFLVNISPLSQNKLKSRVLACKYLRRDNYIPYSGGDITFEVTEDSVSIRENLAQFAIKNCMLTHMGEKVKESFLALMKE